MNIRIRKTIKSDAAQCINLVNSVWRTAYAHIMPREVFDQRDAESERQIKKFEHKKLNKSGNIDYVAVDGDEVVAILHGRALNSNDHYQNLGYADLTAIYIYPKYQNTGLGKRLFNLITSEFKKQRYKTMTIGVLKENIKARKAYEKWGGVLDTTYESTYEKFGHRFSEVFYIFDL